MIQFPQWPVYSYVDEMGKNVIRAWLDQDRVSLALRNALQVYIDMVEHGGPATVPGCIVTVGKGLEAFKGKVKDEAPVFSDFPKGCVYRTGDHAASRHTQSKGIVRGCACQLARART